MTARFVPVHPSSPALTYLRMQSIMRFPEDEGSQNSFIRMMELELPHIPADQAFPSVIQKMLDEIADMKGGFISGQVLLVLARLAVYQSKEASIAKAQFLVSRIYNLHDRTIKQYWSEYRACSHIHAAHYLAHGVYERFRQPEKYSEDILWALAVSQILLDSIRQHGRVQLGDGWWECPPAWHFRTPDFAVPPLGTEALELLAAYRAPTRAK